MPKGQHLNSRQLKRGGGRIRDYIRQLEALVNRMEPETTLVETPVTAAEQAMHLMAQQQQTPSVPQAPKKKSNKKKSKRNNPQK